MAEPALIIQATLAPIFLVNGAAIFLNFTQVRLFRVLDRLRATDKDHVGAAEAERAALDREHSRLIRRAIILRNAILFGVLVIGLTVATTLLLLTAGMGRDAGAWPLGTFAAALVAFGVALALVTADSFMSVAAARDGFRAFAPR